MILIFYQCAYLNSDLISTYQDLLFKGTYICLYISSNNIKINIYIFAILPTHFEIQEENWYNPDISKHHISSKETYFMNCILEFLS